MDVGGAMRSYDVAKWRDRDRTRTADRWAACYTTTTTTVANDNSLYLVNTVR